MDAKSIIRAIMPPALAAVATRFRRRLRPDYIEMNCSWDEAVKQHGVVGWDTATCLAYVTGPSWELGERLAAGEIVGPRESALHAAATMLPGSTLSVLDYGGGLGIYQHTVARARPGVDLDYHVAEVPTIADYGAEHIPGVRFWRDDGYSSRSYALVLALGSAHTSCDWRSTIARLAGATGGVLHLQLLIAEDQRTRLLLGHGWNTKYLAWAICRDDLLSELSRDGLELAWWTPVGPVCSCDSGSFRAVALTFSR